MNDRMTIAEALAELACYGPAVWLGVLNTCWDREPGTGGQDGKPPVHRRLCVYGGRGDPNKTGCPLWHEAAPHPLFLLHLHPKARLFRV